MSSRRRRLGKRGALAKDLVGVCIGDVKYAIDIMRVREIVNTLPLLEYPNPPEHVAGVVDHRSEVVPVVHLAGRLGLRDHVPAARSKWVIVSTRQKKPAALVVDGITEVFARSEDLRRAVPNFGASRDILEAYSFDGELYFVIDVDRVASGASEVHEREEEHEVAS